MVLEISSVEFPRRTQILKQLFNLKLAQFYSCKVYQFAEKLGDINSVELNLYTSFQRLTRMNLPEKYRIWRNCLSWCLRNFPLNIHQFAEKHAQSSHKFILNLVVSFQRLNSAKFAKKAHILKQLYLMVTEFFLENSSAYRKPIIY